jgi:glycosyltransferase involved in cell wall biosynthesis
MVLLEAMAAQVPIVASNVGGVPDLIRDGETGLLCAPLDRSSMLGAVRRIISDRAATREMAVRAKAFARESFRPEIVARRHLEVYREVLSKDV